MNEPLLISGRIPREMSYLAKDYYSFHGETNVKVIRYWYRLNDKRKSPEWLLVHLKDRLGHERSAMCMVCADGDGGCYLSEFLSGTLEKEERLLSDWRRIIEEDMEADT